MKIDRVTGGNFRLIRNLADTDTPEGQDILVIPFGAGAYVVLEKKFPMWENYNLF